MQLKCNDFSQKKKKKHSNVMLFGVEEYWFVLRSCHQLFLMASYSILVLRNIIENGFEI